MRIGVLGVWRRSQANEEQTRYIGPELVLVWMWVVRYNQKSGMACRGGIGHLDVLVMPISKVRNSVGFLF